MSNKIKKKTTLDQKYKNIMFEFHSVLNRDQISLIYRFANFVGGKVDMTYLPLGQTFAIRGSNKRR